MANEHSQVLPDEWVSFPGGELEGRRPKVLCPACREALKREALTSQPRRHAGRQSRALCFQCYRADLDRERAIAAAGQLDTSSDARFQFQLPLEPVNVPRLETLKALRSEERTASVHGLGAYVDKRRQAQIAARHALAAIGIGIKNRQAPASEKQAAIMAAIHAAELQLPDAWLPFVVAR